MGRPVFVEGRLQSRSWETTDGQKRNVIEVAMVNKDLARVETIKKFALLPRRFYEEDGDVTPTKKVKRRFIEQRYKDVIESLYK